MGHVANTVSAIRDLILNRVKADKTRIQSIPRLPLLNPEFEERYHDQLTQTCPAY
jgi:hypothetical protein